MTWPRPATHHLAIDDGRIAYDDTGGPGPLVIGLPGMGDLRREYRWLRGPLQAAGYRVVTLDARGFGETDARWPDLSARAVGRDVQALIAHLQAGPAVVLGNSFAAGSALWAAHEAPDRVRGAVLLGPIVRDHPMPWVMRVLVRLGFAGPWRVAFWMSFWDRLFPQRQPADQAEARAALAANLREPGRMDALRQMASLSKADTEALLPHSRVPVLVVMGSRDPDFADPAAEARWLRDTLKAELLLVDGAGHYPHLDSPDEVAPAVIDFLRRVAPVPLSPVHGAEPRPACNPSSA